VRGDAYAACHALPVGNVTLPTPVFLAGGALCLLAGYLVGAVAGPEGHHGTTAKVVSFDTGSAKLCLEGDSVKDEPGVDQDGVLCGTWSHSTGSAAPRKGDTFRFVTMDTSGVKGSKPMDTVVIYGTVVEE
jgi:hypothetical protein